MKTIELYHNSQIKVKHFKHCSVIKVYTLRGGYAQEVLNKSNEMTHSEIMIEVDKKVADYTAMVNKDISKRTWLNPYTNQESTMITADYYGKDIERAIAKKRFEEATEVHDNQIVIIEGKKYRVCIGSEDTCDPISFLEVL